MASLMNCDDVAAILKILWRRNSAARVVLYLDNIWYADIESHADDDENVKVETGSRIWIWRPFFRNRK